MHFSLDIRLQICRDDYYFIMEKVSLVINVIQNDVRTISLTNNKIINDYNWLICNYSMQTNEWMAMTHLSLGDEMMPNFKLRGKVLMLFCASKQNFQFIASSNLLQIQNISISSIFIR